MALTKISTDGVKDDAITSGKIPANAVGASELADNAVDTNAIANNAVTAGKTSGVQTTINNNADNRVITGSDTSNTLNGESNVLIDANGKLSVGTSGIYNVNVKGSGQQTVLIGSTDAGGAFLTIDGDSNGDGSGGDYCSIGQDTTGNLNISADNPNGNANIIFKSGNASEVARFDSGGLLGIGVTNPSSYDSYANQLVVSGSSHAGMTIRGNYANTGNIYFADGTSGGEKYDGFVSYSYPTARLALGTGGTTRVRVTNDGLCFGSDTAANNAIDDFEKGSWTPRIGPDGNNSVYESGEGTYTKIGDKVTCYYAFRNKNPNSFGSAVVRVWNLPYNIRHAANHNSAHDYGTCEMLYNITFNHNGHTFFYTENNNSEIIGLESRTGTTWVNWNTSSFANNFYLHGHITYFTDNY